MSDGGFKLPDAPAEERAAVKAWAEAVVIPTYMPCAPEKHPMFLEKRVYQGSSGRVYPLPFVDRIEEEKVDRAWEAVHLENEYLRVMILPELGGRIHVGLDKTNGYDFFYRQNVIKPALVGLAGPWISGGVEFNWPQHHRPSTFMRTEWEIERGEDGSVTVWCSEIEPMGRMWGAHGVCLHLGRSVIELKVRLHNRTETMQTFLWWANVGVRVHEWYQSFFPPDVTYVADHAKRAMSRFPLCEGSYYGVDYARAANDQCPMTNDQWEDGSRKRFVPPVGEDGKRVYAANDLSWYANIPVPTSYMAMGSKEDFFGGYDHRAEAGVVHVADHHMAPGKKQWTWGNHEFGYAWDRNLSDDEAPYIELMAGVFTDNQPDFSWLMPGEKRAWSQYWYPIQRIGPAQQANVDAALSLRMEKGQARVGVSVTRAIPGARVRVLVGGALVREWTTDVGPGQPFVQSVAVGEVEATEVRAELLDQEGREVVAYQAVKAERGEVPAAAREPALPAEVRTADELYLLGMHLEQYRHVTRMPEEYWGEALRRDPGDARCNVALGWWRYRRGEFDRAAEHFGKAIETLTKWNPNPREGEAFYGLGVALWRAGKLEAAGAALRKAMWNEAWRAAAERVLERMAGDGAEPRVTGETEEFGLFPSTLEELQGLEWKLRREPGNAKALYDLGNWLYDKRRREEAIGCWEKAVRADRTFAGAWRNLGIGYFNVHKDVMAAKGAYERAMQHSGEGGDARILYERDQLWKRTGVLPEERLAKLEGYPGLVSERDDLTVEWCGLLNRVGRHEEALAVLEARRFQPWEGGEGLVLGQWARTHVALGRLALSRKEAGRAVELFERGLAGAGNLGEAWHLLANQSELQYWLGEAYRVAGDEGRAKASWEKAAGASGDFREMAVCAYSEMSYFSVLALRALGREGEARGVLEGMMGYAKELGGREAKVDYFATSLPTMLLFEDDLQVRQNRQAALLEALAVFGLGDQKTARRMLGDILRDDPNHAVAADLAGWLDDK